ncbi:MAG: glutamate dehydrogenase, partial [Chlamydiae bacterium]|nr:glutamate dehydrogenase [Chlamydiota bacterium]
MTSPDHCSKCGKLTPQELSAAMEKESHIFKVHYDWLENHLPPAFFHNLSHEELMLVAHHLSNLPLSHYFSQIHFKNHALLICLHEPDADIKILKLFNLRDISNYQTFVSDAPLPHCSIAVPLRITLVHFAQILEKPQEPSFAEAEKKELFQLIKKDHAEVSYENFSSLIDGIKASFFYSLPEERRLTILDLFLRSQARDYCQYAIHYDKEWQNSKESPSSVHLLLTWKNVPKYRFLYRLAKMVYRHKLTLNTVNITCTNPYSSHSILFMSLELHGLHGKSLSEEPSLEDFLRELVTLNYFDDLDKIETSLVDMGLLSGNEGNLLRCMVSFIHQMLVHADPHLYSLINIEEAFCRHPELTCALLKLFEYKFHPKHRNDSLFQTERSHLTHEIQTLDTGHETNDIRRKNILHQAINLIDHCLKTNYYRDSKSAFSFRFDPGYLSYLPYDYTEKFPEIPYGIFYIQGRRFIGFHVRFKDLSRGGLRTIIPKKQEQWLMERNQIFAECYNLSYTQQKKNKDIPEGGAKAAILLEPVEELAFESAIYSEELSITSLKEEEIKEKLQKYNTEQKLQYLYASQKAYVHSLITLTNYGEDGILRAKNIVDYYNKPEYIYLGPDENMHNEMLEWIATYSKTCHYPLGKAFISSKPSCGINHKEYGVTSLGVNIYMQEVLKYLDIDPKTQTFTIKMTGGPDGDVAGNQILNLYKHFPDTAKLVALIDGSGTIYEPKGLNLKILVEFFQEGKPIAHYPPHLLTPGGFLLDTAKKKEESAYSQKTLCWKNQEGHLIEEWLSGSEMNHLLRHNVHQTPADIFIPAGGRPRTLHRDNYKDFLDTAGNPTAKAIVEGANLYLTQEARREFEKLGVLVIKDSSAN